jgi:hypothetical protein
LNSLLFACDGIAIAAATSRIATENIVLFMMDFLQIESLKPATSRYQLSEQLPYHIAFNIG